MTERQRELPEEVRQGEIIHQLTLIELQKHDPVFVNRYVDTKAKTEDAADRMRLDLKIFDHVAELRAAGKISPVEQLKKRAAEMVDLGSDELRKAFHDFSREIQKR